ncbi:hypothetical protein [Shewanella sp. SE1]|uniref:hypothetical protein n=1 Tax=Shewanella sp. SE1 TaxID=2705014 RepID=UPI00138F7B69|nr:hypothetical protein [Shewanella sp. SE1]NDO73053.1 hypothetical protein [Shewanella sp. SE1]
MAKQKITQGNKLRIYNRLINGETVPQLVTELGISERTLFRIKSEIAKQQKQEK